MRVIMHLSKATECTTLRLDSNVNCDLGVSMVCQCKVPYCNKCTTQSDADNGGGSRCMGRGKVFGMSLYLPLNFAMNLKL